MLKTTIGIGVGGLIVFVCAGLYYRGRSRSDKFLSTTDWVKLMRKNDARIAASLKRKAAKRRPPEVQGKRTPSPSG